MVLVEDKRTGGFTFTWSIHNFSYLVQKESEYIASPEFVVEAIGIRWYLRLFPRGNDAQGFISYYLFHITSAGVVNFVLSIRGFSGLFKEIGKQTLNTDHVSSCGYKCFLSSEKLKAPGAFLENDTLTLRCRIWKNDTDPTVNYSTHTRVKFSKINYMWILNEIVDCNSDNPIIRTKFNHSRKIQSFSQEIPRFVIHLLYGETFGNYLLTGDAIYFAIEKAENTGKLFVICMIQLIDADGKVAHSVRGEYLFEKSDKPEIWTFPFLSKRKLLSKEKVYFKSGRLTLRCEFYASTGDVINEIDSFSYETTDDVPSHTSNQEFDSDISGTWKENMQRIYNEGKFSDVTVRTPTRQFPVHKVILCAQSEVFSNMFERDMKECRTGVVEIEDMEDDTVSKMLIFLYTDTLEADTLEDFDVSMACKLYFAADKYQITELRQKCSNFLVHSLDTSNFCNVFSLADTHEDQKLKSIALDFILVHCYEIINSKDWKKLMKAKPVLTSETMQLIISKKFLKL